MTWKRIATVVNRVNKITALHALWSAFDDVNDDDDDNKKALNWVIKTLENFPLYRNCYHGSEQ